MKRRGKVERDERGGKGKKNPEGLDWAGLLILEAQAFFLSYSGTGTSLGAEIVGCVRDTRYQSDCNRAVFPGVQPQEAKTGVDDVVVVRKDDRENLAGVVS